MNTSPLCLYSKSVSVRFPIIVSCFSVHNRKINALNIFWCYCNLQLIIPLMLSCLLRQSSVPLENPGTHTHTHTHTHTKKTLFVEHKGPLCEAKPYSHLIDILVTLIPLKLESSPYSGESFSYLTSCGECGNCVKT